MTLGVTFATPLLLIGLLAAAIPLVLHLLSSVRAQEVLFPTLRFLRISMEKTARRRRIQQVLLMFLRMALVALFGGAAIAALIHGMPAWQSRSVTAWADSGGTATTASLMSSLSTRAGRSRLAASIRASPCNALVWDGFSCRAC